MKVVWGKFGTGVDLIVCAISSYWWVSLWVNEKDAFHAYSLKTSIIVFLGIMFFLSRILARVIAIINNIIINMIIKTIPCPSIV